MDNENASPPPRRDQFEHRRDFVRAYDRWRDKNDPRRKARDKARTEFGYQKEQYAKHQEKRLAAKKTDYETERDKHLVRQAQWRDENRDKLQERDRRYYEENPTLIYARNTLRRRRRVQAAPPWLTREQWREMAEMYEVARAMTIKTGVLHEVDHIHPLAGKKSCGLHVPWNLQIMTSALNRRKSNGDPDD